jgi:hypothetical protein
MSWNNMSRCVICGKEIGHKGRGVYAYCDEHRAYAKYDDKILDEMPYELMFSLIAGIFAKAREDYLTDADGKRRDAEAFFRGDWAQMLSLSAFDSDAVLSEMDEEIENGFTEDAGDAL